ncbi:protease inhibitor I9 family protein [Streptomyces sp. APSN-46.1]|uniref:protease inhibitor I9 family protein n=1 Tax=Streptomyces sp. APSN-46.1 TaxID=2929049 RepID=UPI001FB3207F|nr:protease inhibitor I9 family protein [Streptomyces sp. APSN-46.1]MCJ1678587.1 protease inhibitor I9 family protein [Streptomyces sp. APSN-46.1]
MGNRERYARVAGFVLSAAVLAALTVAAPLPAFAAPDGRAVSVPPGDGDPADGRPYIVTVAPGVDPADVAGQVEGVEPLYFFRSTINGFAARLSPGQYAALAALPEVEAIEEDGMASVPHVPETA